MEMTFGSQIVICKPERVKKKNVCACVWSSQIIETVSAVDKDEMAHRQHFTFSLAPEVAHNHNFSVKDNRGEPAFWH